jgi:hypothetical protein
VIPRHMNIFVYKLKIGGHMFRNIARGMLLVLFLGVTILARNTTVHADEYDEYGYQFSPGYYDAMIADPTFGGRQGDVNETQPYPDPPVPSDDSALNNYSSCDYEYCAYGDQPGYYYSSDPAYSYDCYGEYTP